MDKFKIGELVKLNEELFIIERNDPYRDFTTYRMVNYYYVRSTKNPEITYQEFDNTLQKLELGEVLYE